MAWAGFICKHAIFSDRQTVGPIENNMPAMPTNVIRNYVVGVGFVDGQGQALKGGSTVMKKSLV